ncbi:unnamed protein product [Cunninghamella echinulata]
MSLEIEPSDVLTFHRPLTKITEEVLRVRNLKAEPAIFKVKTTAPKQYCVRPNAGIEPFSEIEVHVILQPFKTEPPADYKCKDKFLVQSAAIQPNEDESIPVTDLWGRIEHSKETTIYQHKIKCTFSEDVAIQEQQKETIPEPQPEVIETREIPTVKETPKEQSPIIPVEVGKPKEDLVTVPKAEPAPKMELPEIPTSASLLETPVEKVTSSPPAVVATAPVVSTPVLNDPVTPKVVNEQPVIPEVREVKKETNIPQVVEKIIKNEPVTSSTPSQEVKKEENEKENNLSSRSIVKEQPQPPQQIKKEEEKVDDQEKIKLRQELVSSKENVSRLELELEQLKKELQDLRQKSSNDSTSIKNKKLSPTVQPLDAVHQRLAQLEKPHPTEGYPPQVVAVIGLVIFLFTYLFF